MFLFSVISTRYNFEINLAFQFKTSLRNSWLNWTFSESFSSSIHLHAKIKLLVVKCVYLNYFQSRKTYYYGVNLYQYFTQFFITCNICFFFQINMPLWQGKCVLFSLEYLWSQRLNEWNTGWIFSKLRLLPIADADLVWIVIRFE